MINYKHLRYFWMVANEGSISKASKLLFLTPQTISGQLSLLEEQLGVTLFQREGRSLALTETGKLVQSYANDIFSLGNELQGAIHNNPKGRSIKFKTGIANSIPKSVAYSLLEPVLKLDEPMRLICREDNLTTLLSELATHKLDMVVSDRPMPESLSIKCFNHFLGHCGITFFATKALMKNMQGQFPACLDKMPLLLPGESSPIKNKLIRWLKDNNVHPCIVAEFDDGALMKAFGRKGAGVFVVPSVTANEVRETYHVQVLGETEEVKESFYAISVERKVKHSGTVAILNAAREQLFMQEIMKSKNNEGTSN